LSEQCSISKAALAFENSVPNVQNLNAKVLCAKP